MRKVKVSEAHFNTTSGYAYDDMVEIKLKNYMQRYLKQKQH